MYEINYNVRLGGSRAASAGSLHPQFCWMPAREVRQDCRQRLDLRRQFSPDEHAGRRTSTKPAPRSVYVTAPNFNPSIRSSCIFRLLQGAGAFHETLADRCASFLQVVSFCLCLIRPRRSKQGCAILCATFRDHLSHARRILHLFESDRDSVSETDAFANLTVLAGYLAAMNTKVDTFLVPIYDHIASPVLGLLQFRAERAVNLYHDYYREVSIHPHVKRRRCMPHVGSSHASSHWPVGESAQAARARGSRLWDTDCRGRPEGTSREMINATPRSAISTPTAAQREVSVRAAHARSRHTRVRLLMPVTDSAQRDGRFAAII
jgi:hypothetical protein